MTKSRKKKYIAPIVFVVLAILYEFAMVVALVGFDVFEGKSFWIPLLVMIIPAAVAVALIVVLVERIKEIRGGEEDVASKY
ncbi:MAG: MMPL family transporter [Anaerovoracaceae bacterium]